MADTDRQTPLTVENKLRDNFYAVSFFNALRRIECEHADRPRLGTSQLTSEDPVRLGQEASLAFETSTLASFEPASGSKAPRIFTRFFGLFGPNGPLPLHLTEYARDRIRHQKDPTFARFADIFHHRMLCLFYRAWADAQPTVSYDRPDADRFATYVGSLFGFGMETLHGLDGVADTHKLYFAGLFSAQTRHPDGLGTLLRHYFKIQAEIREFIGEWMSLPNDSLWRLGARGSTGILGDSIILGDRVWSGQYKFRIVIGPLSLENYSAFLPGGDHVNDLVVLVRNYAGDELVWDLSLVLRKQEVPSLCLDGNARLGWTCWLGDRLSNQDADDLTLNPFPVTNDIGV